jgi:RNA polymerase sigma-70 factor (sigma-E family)
MAGMSSEAGDPDASGLVSSDPGPALIAAEADHSAAASPQTIVKLFREHHLELVHLAVVMVGDLAAAEDIVQDVFERLHRRWHDLREPSRGLAYARSAVLNSCRSAHRRAAVVRKYAPRLTAPAGPDADAASAVDDRGELAAVLRLLPRRQREVLVLRYYADLSVAEVAETLRITPSAVRAFTSRGLAALARATGGQAMNTLEDRLRRELRQLRPDPESLRPLRIPPPRRSARTRHWLVPLAAVAAVVVIIAAVVVWSGLSASESAPIGATGPMTSRLAGSLPRYCASRRRCRPKASRCRPMAPGLR